VIPDIDPADRTGGTGPRLQIPDINEVGGIDKGAAQLKGVITRRG
jgi:hypothetical protein